HKTPFLILPTIKSKFLSILNSIPVGQLRFDMRESDALISYSVDYKYRGMGLGTIFLSIAIEKILKERNGIKSITGFVQQQNKASVKSFQKLCFAQFEADAFIYPNSYKFVKTIA
ncbi:MAG TPA: GNAT family N-acetyltransferase, partial [Bacteroidales bacterium]|nr:GNAT family N-acetyltransferase [Bacteroidales bacterium]